jgi:hypothetical protein
MLTHKWYISINWFSLSWSLQKLILVRFGQLREYMYTWRKPSPAVQLIQKLERKILDETHMAVVPYSAGLKILINAQQHLEGSNPAPWGGVSAVATWWASQEAQAVIKSFLSTA